MANIVKVKYIEGVVVSKKSGKEKKRKKPQIKQYKFCMFLT